MLESVRYAGDEDAACGIFEDEELGELVERFSGSVPHGPQKDLLANAVHVDADVLPQLRRTVDAIHQRAGVEDDIELFVHQSPSIGAAVLKVERTLFVLLTSAAIEKLDERELEFAVGHELGHAVFGHFDIPVGVMLGDPDLSKKHAMQLLSWSRRAEISADRAGLLCCGSLEVAASAFFKVLSGLSLERGSVNPVRFADQFDRLRREIWREGAHEMWRLSHPLAPLRMRALLLFWETEHLQGLLPEAPGGGALDRCDREIASMLAYMDPLTQRSTGSGADPMLLPFLTWGGLRVIAANGRLARAQVRALGDVVGERHLEEALASQPKSVRHFKSAFQGALADRVGPVSALDIRKVLEALVPVASADGGGVNDAERDALRELAELFGVAPGFVDRLL